ncbi:MAG: hypothetical protein DMG41_36230 [Acidobacteria bacterium]|nr:MAG: hypothetical protein DMG42_25760 [Acidobacteriota bacterium]PYT80911.1 MAG: hypothetical protein DMG41_36230 [Acidobacteriota bacterium]
MTESGANVVRLSCPRKCVVNLWRCSSASIRIWLMTLYDKDEASDLTPKQRTNLSKASCSGHGVPKFRCSGQPVADGASLVFRVPKKRKPARWLFQVARRSENTGLD